MKNNPAAIIATIILIFLLIATTFLNLVLIPFILYIIGNLFFAAPFYAYQIAWIGTNLLIRVLK